MSRTRKDRPYFVRANDRREPRTVHHAHEMQGRTGVSYMRGPFAYADHCTEGQPAVRRCNDDRDALPPCTVELGSWAYGPTYGPRREDTVEYYWVPARQAERSILRQLTAEYNTLGDIEEDFVLPGQHRHATYGGGYWD